MRGQLLKSILNGPPTVSRSLQSLAALVFVCALAFTAAELIRMRAARIADAERHMTHLDTVLVEQTSRAVETIDLLMQTLADAVEAERPRWAAAAVNLDDLIRRRIEGVRQIRSILIVDPAGRPVLSSEPAVDPAYLDLARKRAAEDTLHLGTDLRIGDPMRASDGTWTASISRRMHTRGGRYDGSIFAFMDLQYFTDFYETVDLAERAVIILHRRDGMVLARYPRDDTVIGASYADLPPFTEVLAHSMGGTVTMNGPTEGGRRVVAIQAVQGLPLAVNVSIDERSLLAGWHRQLVMFAAGAVALSVMFGGLLLLLARRSGQIETLLRESRSARDLAELNSQQLRQQMTEREQAEAALRQSQRLEALGQLTGGVAHDFNNLLTIILGNVDLLQQGGVLDRATVDRLAVVNAAAERGATLTSQLLAFARRQPLTPQVVDLNLVVGAMDNLLRSALGGGIRIEMALAPDLWPALVDPTQIELVVLNLAINARDAMSGGGRLRVGTCNAQLGPPRRAEEPPGGEYVGLAITDQGHGMTDDVMERAIEPFFTTKPPGAGSGLGLSQVYGLARQSGGGVTFDSTPGLGTTVHVYLPRARDRVASLAEHHPPQRPVSGKTRLLLVDDDEAVRETTAMILERLGYVVVTADGGIAAMEVLTSTADIDLLLTDVAMPGVTGPELARHAASLRPDLPIVYISGFADPQTLARNQPMQRLVRKPFRAATLTAQIEQALAEARRARTS